ncbi:MAG: beta-ketoacyl synthase chain length factor [Puniceicoccales bacterium]|jgi:hypothetical protein|nr:beta-ketoacyl synthase chain length factor [Puniceicoccales bacterium]
MPFPQNETAPAQTDVPAPAVTPPAAVTTVGTPPLQLADWFALAPEITGAAAGDGVDFANGHAPATLPMMVARRLSEGTRLALQTGLPLLQKFTTGGALPAVSALVFSSRHGESERTLRVLQAIAAGNAISPTDFTMAVHNTAVGQLTITAGAPLPASSVSAGDASFAQALFEVFAFLAAGHGAVLHVDFETRLPAPYHEHVSPVFPPYAAAFVWRKAAGSADLRPVLRPAPPTPPPLPPALAFLRDHLAAAAHVSAATPS